MQNCKPNGENSQELPVDTRNKSIVKKTALNVIIMAMGTWTEFPGDDSRQASAFAEVVG